MPSPGKRTMVFFIWVPTDSKILKARRTQRGSMVHKPKKSDGYAA
jgi:hypothetical protein